VSNDDFGALRRGMAVRFRPLEIPRGAPRRRHSRSRFRLWQRTRAFGGNWFPLLPAPPPTDALQQEERERDAARLVLERHGIVFRELLEREAPPLRWGPLFRALRLLELSGEVLSGRFFEGIPGPQFMLPEAFERLRCGLDHQLGYHCTALDPAAPCALKLPGLPQGLPRRSPGNHLFFQGPELILTSARNGRELHFRHPADHPLTTRAVELLRELLLCRPAPAESLTIETINDAPAAHSPYREALAARLPLEQDDQRLLVDTEALSPP
jgi:ATP-dependent Lhr-like helicase